MFPVTVGVAWIRTSSRGEELWFASDSRLCGDGTIWDECPKLMVSHRRDLALAFSGGTAQAYPLLLQIESAINAYQSARDGTLELTYLVEHLERVVNHMLRRIGVDPQVRGAGSPPPFRKRGDAILLGGYSRHTNGLLLRALQYDKASDSWKFVRTRARSKIGRNKIFRIFGDRTAASRFAYLLNERLRVTRKLKTAKPFALEPLEVLWEFVGMSESTQRPLPANRRPPSVGGPVQVLQVRPGGSATPLAVRWAAGGRAAIHLLGREALAQEHLDVPLLERVGEEFFVRARGQWAAPEEESDASG
jgi:hypothetical protein